MATRSQSIAACMAVCDFGHLNMPDWILNGLNHTSYVHRHALADGAERGLICSCCQPASLWVRRFCPSCGMSTSGRLLYWIYIPPLPGSVHQAHLQS